MCESTTRYKVLAVSPTDQLSKIITYGTPHLGAELEYLAADTFIEIFTTDIFWVHRSDLRESAFAHPGTPGPCGPAFLRVKARD
jgi:hypothetical protein